MAEAKGRPGWQATAAVFALASVTESLGFGHLGAFTPLYLAQLHVPQALIPLWTGLLGAIGWVIGIPLIPFWGVWAEKYSRKLVIVRSSYVEALLFGLAAVSQSVWMLAVARFLSGFVVGNTGVMFAVQADRTPPERLGLAVAVISAASPVGMAIGPYLGALVIAAHGIRTLLGLDAALCLAAGVTLTLAVVDSRGGRTLPQSTSAILRQTLGSLRQAPVVLRLFLLTFLAGLGSQVVGPYTPLLIAQLWHGPHLVQGIGLILTLSGILLALGTPLWGRLGDLWGHRRSLGICSGVAAVALGGQAAAPGLGLFAALRMVQSLFTGGIGAMSTTLIAREAPEDQRAAILNFSLLPMQMSWFLGPLAGAVVSHLAGVRSAFWLAALAALGAFLLAQLQARRPEGTSRASAGADDRG